jgi:transcriptional regulator with XRE-family HTH domain
MPPKKKNPIDVAIRARLRALDLPQKELADAVGRSKSWVSKYLSGAGNATIDELIRILAIADGVHGLSAWERRLLKAWKRLPAASQADAVKWFEGWVRREVRLARTRR